MSANKPNVTLEVVKVTATCTLVRACIDLIASKTCTTGLTRVSTKPGGAKKYWDLEKGSHTLHWHAEGPPGSKCKVILTPKAGEGVLDNIKGSSGSEVIKLSGERSNFEWEGEITGIRDGSVSFNLYPAKK